MKFLPRACLALAIAVASLAGWPSSNAEAREQHVQRVANRTLSGIAYARLRRLSYEQCEQQCLADDRCVALQHYKGKQPERRSSTCALYSSFGKEGRTSLFDIGYKRPGKAVAEKPAPAEVARERNQAETSRSLTERPNTGAWRTEQPKRAYRQLDREVAKGVTRGSPPSPAPAVTQGEARTLAREAPSASAAPSPTPSPEALTRSVVPPAGGATPDWHVVPVIYGTDRNRNDTDKRIGYANDRGRRLELGQALVTVPSNHKVPNLERPWALRIPYLGYTIYQEAEDPKRHFTIQEIKALGKDQVLAIIRDRLNKSKDFRRQAIVFIHGYNVGFDDALYRTAQISYDLNFDGAAFTYSWPSGTGWTSYPYDRDSAAQAEPYLFEFLQMVQQEIGDGGINIIAHSMGNQMLLRVLRQLQRRSPGVSHINQIVLAAPDVDRDSFENLAAEIRGVAKGITLYAASNDIALDASRIFAGNRPRAGDVPSGGPVVVEGVDTIDISEVSTSYLSLNHSKFAEHTDLLKDLNQLIRTGLRPPEARISAYSRIQGASGTYWRYVNQR